MLVPSITFHVLQSNFLLITPPFMSVLFLIEFMFLLSGAWFLQKTGKISKFQFSFSCRINMMRFFFKILRILEFWIVRCVWLCHAGFELKLQFFEIQNFTFAMALFFVNLDVFH